MLSGKDLGHGELLKVLMIHDHINQSTRTFKVVSPDTESIEDHQQFFVVSVIVEFRCTEDPTTQSTTSINPSSLVWYTPALSGIIKLDSVSLMGTVLIQPC